MTITSFSYLVLLTIGAILYYILPKSFQWLELLLISIIFYCLAAEPFTLIYIVISTVLAWGCTNGFVKIQQNFSSSFSLKYSRTLMMLTIGINIFIWFIFKGGNFWKPIFNGFVFLIPKFSAIKNIEFVAALGMGYYTLQVIGYILDCYWGIIKAQKNIFKLFLFVCFFPQLVTGPISRYEQLKSVYEEHRFSYLNVTYGAQRILWGFFKKIVLAERAAIIVNTIWADLVAYKGLYTWIALFVWPIQIYADFSGCMDIALGTAELFGIKLPENFNNPFFSKTSQEFWQRWHITLGNWAKDYVLYPLLKSKAILKLGKISKSKLGKKAGRFIPTAVGMLGLWMVLGVWHGEFKYVVGVSLWYWVILIMGQLFAPIFSKILKIMNIRMDIFSWRLFQMIRTYIILAIGVIFFRAEDLREALDFILNLCKAFQKEDWNPWIFFDGSILNLGITYLDLNIMIFAIMLLLIVAVLREKYGYARIWVAQQLLPFRWFIWLGLFIFVLIYGMYGPGYSAAEFIYQGF